MDHSFETVLDRSTRSGLTYVSGPDTRMLPRPRSGRGTKGTIFMPAALVPAQRSSPGGPPPVEGLPVVHLTDAVVQDLTRVVTAVVRSRVSSSELAEDIVQDTWVIVLEKLHSFEQRSSLRTWVVGIALNVTRARLRLERHAVPVDPTEVEERLGAAADPLPDECVVAAEMGAAFSHALHALPQRQQQVLRQRDVVGRTSQEVCVELGISAGNQRILLHRARVSIRRSLQPLRGPVATT